MSKTSTLATTVVILIVVLGVLYFWAPESFRFWGQTANTLDSFSNNEIPKNPAPHERINAKHQYKNGTHTIVGEANSPTPCHILTTDALIAESYPEQVTLKFLSESTGEICAQVITSNRFKIQFQAGSEATIKATWNGQSVELNLIPAGENEDLDNFELFIKG